MVWILGWFRENRAVLTGFKVGIYRKMIKISKSGGEVKKGENQISRREPFFSFLSIKLLSHFVPVSLDTTLKERSLG